MPISRDVFAILKRFRPSTMAAVSADEGLTFRAPEDFKHFDGSPITADELRLIAPLRPRELHAAVSAIVMPMLTGGSMTRTGDEDNYCPRRK